MQPVREVYVIGIDGGTFRIIDPLMDRGELPAFRHIVENGVRSVLHSTIPANSAVAWSSFMTGKNPGKHGVFGFISYSPARDRLTLTNGSYVKSRTLWDIASEAGRSVAVLNVPLTYPPKPVNGLLVSGMDASSLKNLTYPPEFGEELVRVCPSYQIDLPHVQHDRFQASLGSRVTQLVEARKQAMLHMLEKAEPQLFVGVFTCTDRIQHHFWHAADVTHPKHRLAKDEEREIIADTYRQIDRILTLFLKRMSPETTLFVVSDHGFCGSTRRFMVNLWLGQRGWLRPAKRPANSTWSRVLHGVKRRPRLYMWARTLKNAIPGLEQLAVRERAMNRSLSDKIDWSATKAYYFPPGIRINLKDREPFGVVERAEFEPLRQAIMRALTSLCDEAGHPVFAEVRRREELYFGPHLDLAPDIILEPSVGNNDPRQNFSLGRRMRISETGGVFAEAGTSGEHDSNGILLGIGRPLQRGSHRDGAAITDIAPTVLHLLGLPIPSDMDGKVLLDFFSPEFINQTTPRYTDQSAEGEEPEWDYGDLDEELVRERLRELGYLA